MLKKFLVLLIALIAAHHVHTQSATGLYPPPTTVALNKPIVVSSTCGTEGAESFCDFTFDLSDSLAPNCIISICNDTCPYSESSPFPTDLATIGIAGDGVTTEFGGPSITSTSVLKFANSYVYISNISSINANSFSFAVWIKQDLGNNGTLISKSDSNGTNTFYTISVTETSLTFHYRLNHLSGPATLLINNIDLSSSFWHHIAVTVYQNDFAFYINGSIENATSLLSAINDLDEAFYLGQTAQNVSHYNGLMQDIFLYSQALTEREVQELVTGQLPFIYLSSNCHCPPSHPVISTINPDRCIQHTGVTTGRGSAIRINTNSHTSGFANDNIYVTSWISAANQKEVNLSMSLIVDSKSAYELIFVFINYGAPPPKAAILEKSIDGGQTYQPLQYFADDCNLYFGLANDMPLTNPDEVNCITTYSSQIPLTDQTARVRFLDPAVRPGAYDTSPGLRNFILADHIKLTMLDFFTDNTTDQHRYYDIVEITVAARCACNGHADECSANSEAICQCNHNTKGDRCNECLDLYNDKPWREGTVNFGFPCKLCNCNDHASSCVYNASLDIHPESYDNGGGGVCVNCQDNTDGRNCETCIEGFYRPAGIHASDTSPCQSCDCSIDGSVGVDCVKHEGIPGKVAGDCACKENVQGRTCNQCKFGFFNLTAYNLDGCESCNCNVNGTVDGSNNCNSVTGKCSCKKNVEGLKCDLCINGTHGLSESNTDGCSPCSCNLTGSVDYACDRESGQCTCKKGVNGKNCDFCAPGYHSLSNAGCQECLCSTIGSVNNICNDSNGVCQCHPGFTGDLCDRCANNFFNFTAGCLPCNCSHAGTVEGETENCNNLTGQCLCKANVQQRQCDSCIDNYTNLQSDNPLGCSFCNCVTSNTNMSSILCDPVTSECFCLPFASGLNCELCNIGFYHDNVNNTCSSCLCNNEGSQNISCNSTTGQCHCKNTMIDGRDCSTCLNGHYGFPDCFSCKCNSSGSLDTVCNATTGTCHCKQFVMGMNCDICKDSFQYLEASNPFGCSKAPAEQNAPSLISQTFESIQISWTEPLQPNGVISLYNVYRNNTLIKSVPEKIKVYNDTELMPNTVYAYQVASVNIVGEVISPPLITSTSESTPAEVNPPVLLIINSTSIQALWQTPNISNGVIINYKLNLVAINNMTFNDSQTKFTGNATSATIGGLNAFTVNYFVLQACTAVGCSSSNTVSIRTSESLPEFQPAPTLIILNSSSIHIVWNAPTQPNGEITMYHIFQRLANTTGNSTLVNVVPASVFQLVVTGLKPYTAYEYRVVAYTSAGGTSSVWIQARTAEGAPENVTIPELIAISATKFQVNFTPPGTPNGVITAYLIFLQNLESGVNVSLANYSQPGMYTVTGLTPFTQYGVYISVCNSAGCSFSQISLVTTFEAVPQGVDAPYVNETTNNTVKLTWNTPSEPNGIILRYNITKVTPSLLAPLHRDLGISFYGTSYASFPPELSSYGDSIVISFYFKTVHPNGLLIYWINSVGTDLFAIELQGGIPWYIFDSGSGLAVLTTNISFNDGEWHYLHATKNGKTGILTIDDIYTTSGSSLGSNQFLGAADVFYIGGLPNDAPLTTLSGNGNHTILKGYNFSGCLFAVRVDNVDLDFKFQLNHNSGVGSPHYGCPINLETGISFIGGGYLMTKAFQSPGNNAFTISVAIKTKATFGLIFFAHGNNSHIIISIANSSLVLRLKGTDIDELLVTTNTVICNGQWHKLDVIKESDGIIVRIDDVLTSSLAVSGFSLNTNSLASIGGLPLASTSLEKYQNITFNYPYEFTGCMKNFSIDNTAVDLTTNFVKQKHVRFYGCEDNSLTFSCEQERSSFTSNGSLMFTDSKVHPFSEHVYQVIAQNSAGAAYSTWTSVVTLEGASTPVRNVSVINVTSTSFSLTWQKPSQPNGVITQYDIVIDPVQTTGLNVPLGESIKVTQTIKNPNDKLMQVITGLQPATNYSVIFLAYSRLVSGDKSLSYFSTHEDVPVGVQPPFVTSQTSTSFEFIILPPTQPNGAIVLYKVFINGLVLNLNSSQQTATVDNLSPFTTYEFYIEACTTIGCTNSSINNSMTLSAPPIGLVAPHLNALSPTTVTASWNPPSYTNGIILYYELVQLTGNDAETTIFNGTDQQHTITNLSPNTNYFFKVIAHNLAGSVSSNVSSLQTPEGIPDQILPPNITILNSSSLLVNWQVPLLPNGNITNYTLIQNNSNVFSGLSFSIVLTSLQPFTIYSYALQVCTGKGCGTSIQTVVQTSEAIPQEYVAPVVSHITSHSITVAVQEVLKPNGIVTYMLRVTGEFLLSNTPIGRNTTTETRTIFNNSIVKNVTIVNLLPFSQYSYQLEVVNSVGSLFGAVFNVTTLSAVPELQMAPLLLLLSATSIRVEWQPPAYANGLITTYTLNVFPVVTNTSVIYPNNVTITVLEMLNPFTPYSVSITVSNTIGNATSDTTNITTGETAPYGFDQVTVLSNTAYSIVITWDPPSSPNGIISNYTVIIDSNLFKTLHVAISMYNVSGLLPYSTYNVSVAACNNAGCTETPVIAVTTDEAAPGHVQPPHLIASTTGFIIITWFEPDQPNGLITSYTIYKSMFGELFSKLTDISPSAALKYNDSNIAPFTTYEYYIEVTNSAGSTSGNSSSITTFEAAPTNVSQPILQVISSNLIRIIVLPPVISNGILRKYIITRNMEFAITLVVENPSHPNITYLDGNLTPYTNYTYEVVACTEADCSMPSPQTFAFTLQAPPQSAQSPTVILNSNETLTVTWQSPLVPNGNILNYTLIRANLGFYNNSVINCCQQNLNNLSSICSFVAYTAFDVTSYMDVNLTYYSFYQYCVIATNIAGSIESNYSDAQRTVAAPNPLAGPTITGFALNSTAIKVVWSQLDRDVLLGPLESYLICFSGTDGLNGTDVTFHENYTLTGLIPSTFYTFKVFVNNSRGNAQSNIITIETLDGIPVQVLAPSVFSISATSLLIIFKKPLMPNGMNLTYTILLNSVVIHNQTTAGNYIATGLKPFTNYTAQLEVCTIYGCTKSELSSNTTLQAAPEGFASPYVEILGSHDAFVSWSTPSQPNGIISEYQLYIREQVPCIQEVGETCYNLTLLSSGSIIFSYNVTNLFPATTYEFGVIAINNGGNASSGFTSNTTYEAPPTVVQSPILTPLSSSAICIEWEVPSEPNGVVTAFYVFRNGTQILGPTLNLKYTSSSLSPYTFYSFVIQVCTSAGCTNSSTEVVATLEAPPMAFDNPVISEIDATSLTISWTPPANPNGINIYYAIYYANNTFITNTTFTNISVTGLNPFTNYSFYVTVCNGAGCTFSDVVSVLTNESLPIGAAITLFTALSFDKIEITWAPPTQPNGVILYYRLFRDDVLVFQNNTLQFIDKNLEGGVTYTYKVQAVNSAGGSFSPSISLTTPTASPTGINPPTTYVINSTAIYVEWGEPQKANGDILSYELYLNNTIVYEDLAFNYTLTNLSAYTVYAIRIQVCTVQGDCGSSISVMNITDPDVPSGVGPPVSTTVTKSSAVISWLPPAVPNGIITSYRIMRRLSNNPLVVIFVYVGGPNDFTFTDQGLNPFTQYEYQLEVVNNAGSMVSSWTLVTTLEDSPSDINIPVIVAVFSTNVTLSWESPLSPNGIIKQYNVLYRLLLGNITLALTLPGNVTEATITGLKPYTTYEFKVRAINSAGSGDSPFEVVTTLESAPEMVGFFSLVTKTSESLTLTWSPPSVPNGMIINYVIYLNGVEEYRGVHTTYTINRLKPYTGYFLELEACTSVGCSRGAAIQSFTTAESDPIGQVPPDLNVQGSRSVLIQWKPPTQQNGIITSYEIFRMQVLELQLVNETEGAILVHVTYDVANRLYNDTSLIPDTGYQYAVRANNSVGSSTSAFTYIQTLEDVPEFVPEPLVETINANEIRVTWNAPLLPNGDITTYEVFQIGPNNITTSEYVGLNKLFTDTGLKPYTLYQYKVQACTIVGCTNGSIAANITSESIPEGFSIPNITALSNSEIGIMWKAPSMPNGIIATYIVEITSPINISIPTKHFSLNVTSLQPFTTYTVIVKACTIIGCASTADAFVKTLESTPMIIAAPSVLVTGPTSTDCEWTAPAQPNGVIIKYILQRNHSVVYDGLNISFVDTNLLPNHPYFYDVQAFTSVGGSERSPFTFVTTDSDTPTDLKPPNLTAITSTSVLAEWSVPGNPNGIIEGYKLYRKIENNESLVYSGSSLGFLVNDLLVFTTYLFRIEACTTTCGSSLYNQVTTLEDFPSGLSSPTLHAFSNETVLIKWLPPSSPNGIITSYSLQRRQVIGGGIYGSVVDVSSNISPVVLQYLDEDTSLAPALTYQYRIGVANNIGGYTSQYSTVTLPDGIPTNLSKPFVVNKTSTTITLMVTPPGVPNGAITEYRLYGMNLLPKQITPSSQLSAVTFEVFSLTPFTLYVFYAEACTISGCGASPNVTVQTNPDLPTDLAPPIATVTGPRGITLNWSTPINPNGIISKYSLWFKTPCPQPPTQSLVMECIESDYQFVHTTSVTSFDFTSNGMDHPYPYRSYQFLLEAENSVGKTNSTISETVTTLPSTPEVIHAIQFSIFESNQSIFLNWTNSFRLNGMLSHYIVIRDGYFLLQGTQTFALFGNQQTDIELQFSVKAVTTVGEVTTPALPLFITGPKPSISSSPTLVTDEPSDPTTPFYEQPPFIIGMIVLVLLVCFVSLLVFLCFIRPRTKAEKYDVITLKSQGSPVRDDGTVRASWGLVDSRITPVPSYHEAMQQSNSSNVHIKSYSPSKVALLTQDFNDIPLQDTHITRLSKIENDSETVLNSAIDALNQQTVSLPPTIVTPNSTSSHSRSSSPLKMSESTFMDTRI